MTMEYIAAVCASAVGITSINVLFGTCIFLKAFIADLEQYLHILERQIQRTIKYAGNMSNPRSARQKLRSHFRKCIVFHSDVKQLGFVLHQMKHEYNILSDLCVFFLFFTKD